MLSAPILTGKKILITGVTGLIARPIALMLAQNNEVWGLSLFNEAEAATRALLEAVGVKCIPWNMATDAFPPAVPADITHILHTAMLRETESFDAAMDVNGVAVAKLMDRFRGAEAFYFISSTAIYQHLEPEHRHKETDPLGGGLVFIPAYQVSKIAAEAVVRSLAQLYDLPTVIIRPGICYGPGSWGGVPILFLNKMLAGEPIELPPEGYTYAMPIDVDDIARFTPSIFNAASVPATIVNMAGDDAVSDVEYIRYISEITGVPVEFLRGTYYRDNYLTDNSKREAIAGKCQIHWKDGIARAIAAHFPDMKLKQASH
ncbi:NAD-dependent epimerase/dehydratase family protein [Rhizorhabdus argentea]|uniref:NAD-dependent epimerase/dehydratase family protein n=1 Tax=Rhizorhabdus argentea TaxID=1387174 RepID=UPI0030EF15E5